MVLPSFSPHSVRFVESRVQKRRRTSRAKVLRLIRIRLTTPSLPKIVRVCQDNSPQARIADSSSRNAVNFSSACTTNRFSSPRCASTIQIVRPLESIGETHPQLQPALRIVDYLRRRLGQFEMGNERIYH